MAILQIRPRDPSQARAAQVTITLCDTVGKQADGYVTATGAPIAARYTGRTDTTGTLDVDLTPNADVTGGSGYRVQVGERVYLIVKSSATQTIGQALATPPAATGTLAPGVPASGLTGQSLVKNSATNYDVEWQHPHRPTGARWAAIGDSIVAGNDSNLVSGASWYDQLCALLQGRVINVVNAGVAFNYSFECSGRFATDVLAQNPDVVFIHCGTNDIPLDIALNGSYLFSRITQANIQSMVTAALSAGVLPVIVSQVPRNLYVSQILALNNGLALLARTNDVPYLDFSRTIVNAANGQIASASSADGIHPNAAGARLLANAALNFVNTRLASLHFGHGVLPFAHDADTSAQGSLWASGSSGGIPTGWSNYQPSGVSATPSVVAPGGSDGIAGNWFRLTTTGVAGFHGIQRSGFTLTAGNVVQFSARIRTSNVAATTQFNVELDTSGSSTDLTIFGPSWAGQTVDGVFVGRFVVPTGVTTGTIRIYFAAGTGGGEVCDVADLTLRDLTAAGNV